MEDSYLVPANAKRSTLILGWFNTMDLIIFLIGAAFSLGLLIALGSTSTNSLDVMILIILPALVTTTLVLPVPHYHNVLQLLINIFNFFTKQKNYRWKGWNILEDEK